ncbi:hypothetical protein [Hyphomonas sp.]
MDRPVVDLGVRFFFEEAGGRLEAATAVAKAAEACAETADLGKAVAIANDVDDPVEEADRLIGMAATLSRLSRGRRGQVKWRRSK